MEYKALETYSKLMDDDRTVIGYASIFGNVDSYGDRVMPGAFKKTIKERTARVKHLWMHDPFSPPTAAIKSLREVGRDELPDVVLKAYPDATGGLEVTREYLNTPRGNEILEGIKAGAIAEMSFGFDVMKWDNEDVKDGPGTVRNLKELRLWDTSDVTWGANAATVAAKTQLHDLVSMSRAWVQSPDALDTRVFSEEQVKRLNDIMAMLADVLNPAEPPTPEDNDRAKALTEQALRRLALAETETAIYAR